MNQTLRSVESCQHAVLQVSRNSTVNSRSAAAQWAIFQVCYQSMIASWAVATLVCESVGWCEREWAVQTSLFIDRSQPEPPRSDCFVCQALNAHSVYPPSAHQVSAQAHHPDHCHTTRYLSCCSLTLLLPPLWRASTTPRCAVNNLPAALVGRVCKRLNLVVCFTSAFSHILHRSEHPTP